MKTLLVGVVLGVVAKYWWDSEYGDELRDHVNKWWSGVLSSIDEKIVKTETTIENAATKVDRAMNS